MVEWYRGGGEIFLYSSYFMGLCWMILRVLIRMRLVYMGGPRQQYLTRQLMRQVKQQCRTRVVFFCDFNEIACNKEKEGRVHISDGMLDAFREVRDDYAVHDLGFKGSLFTWQRGNNPSTLIRKRLDMMFPSEDWCDMFSSWELFHLPRYRSDHCLLLL